MIEVTIRNFPKHESAGRLGCYVVMWVVAIVGGRRRRSLWGSWLNESQFSLLDVAVEVAVDISR